MDGGRSTARAAIAVLLGVLILLSSAALLPGGAVRAAPTDVTYSTNTTLTSDVYCDNLTIERGITLTTNGFEIYCSGAFENQGILDTGIAGNGGIPGVGSLSPPSGAGGGGGYGVYIQANSIAEGSIIDEGGSGATCTLQYCGGGGGGGGGLVLLAYGTGGISNGTVYASGGTAGAGLLSLTAPGAQPGGGGGATVSASGFGAGCDTQSRPGQPGTAPVLSYNLLATWYTQGMSTYLMGGGGGGGAGATGAGSSGGSDSSSYGGGGGGGGSQCEPGAPGGNGLTLKFDYGANPPISVTSPPPTKSTTTTTTVSASSSSSTAPPPWAFNGAYANYSYSFQYKDVNTTLYLDIYVRSVNATAGTFYVDYFCTGTYCGLVADNPSVFNGQGSFGIPSPFPATGTNGLNFLGNNTEEFNGAQVNTNVTASVPGGIFQTFQLATGSDTTWYDLSSGLVIRALFTTQGFTGVTGAEPPLSVLLLATNVPTTMVPGSGTTESTLQSTSTTTLSTASSSSVSAVVQTSSSQASPGTPLVTYALVIAVVAAALVAILAFLMTRSKPKPT